MFRVFLPREDIAPLSSGTFRRYTPGFLTGVFFVVCRGGCLYHDSTMTRYCKNQHRLKEIDRRPAFDSSALEPRSFHQSIDTYSVTPLISLPGLAERLQIGHLFIKDESHRFGLKAFKGLGGSYAIYRLYDKIWREEYGKPLTPARFWTEVPGSQLGPSHFCTATDGNHGRGVAWMARLINRKATIYMPRNSASARIENIKSEGAEVVVVDGDYDLAVRTAAARAAANNWQMISDTSYEGYTEIPGWISSGYLTLFDETEEQLRELGVERIDSCLIPGGVGALAAAAALHFRTINRDEKTRLVSIEPESSDCLLESALDRKGALRRSHGEQNSIMAGLNCATPSLITWPIIKAAFDLFISIPDHYAERAMNVLYHSIVDKRRIISGESGAASMAGLLALLTDPELQSIRDESGLDRSSNILIINTEGDTDPVSFRQIVGSTQT